MTRDHAMTVLPRAFHAACAGDHRRCALAAREFALLSRASDASPARAIPIKGHGMAWQVLMIALLFKPHLDEARIKAEFDAILQEQRQARIDAGLAIHGARAHVPPHRVRGSGSATSRAGLTEDEWKEEEENENENEEASSMGHMDFYKVLETRSVGDS